MNSAAKNTLWTILGLVVVVILAVVFLRSGSGTPNTNPNNNASSTAGWMTSADDARGISFKYPSDLGTKYLQTSDWPPQVAVLNGPLNCVSAGTETDRAGQTEQKVIGGHTYCITKVAEGAAGSIYTQYAYARQMPDGRVAILNFTIRSPQCVNYDDPQKTECTNEEATFNLDGLVDQIFGTLTLGAPTLDYQKG